MEKIRVKLPEGHSVHPASPLVEEFRNVPKGHGVNDGHVEL